ncbi:MAG: hypothetical protein ACP5I3_11625 [Thermoproteus sp.]
MSKYFLDEQAGAQPAEQQTAEQPERIEVHPAEQQVAHVQFEEEKSWEEMFVELIKKMPPELAEKLFNRDGIIAVLEKLAEWDPLLKLALDICKK